MLVLSTGWNILLAWTFFAIMAQGGSGVVNINAHGEMWIEAVLIPVSMALQLVACVIAFDEAR